MASFHHESGLVGPGHENVSMSTSRKGAGFSSMAMFNTTLECEKRVRVWYIIVRLHVPDSRSSPRLRNEGGGNDVEELLS